MSLQNLYNTIIETAIMMYQNETEELKKIPDIMIEMNNLLKVIVGKSLDEAQSLCDVMLRLEESYRTGDKLAVGDILYLEICSWILQDAHNNNITITDRRKSQDNKITKDIADYNENIKAFCNINSSSTKRINEESTKFDPKDESILVDKYRNIAICSNKKYWQLNSFGNENVAVQYALEDIKKKNYIHTVIVIGMANLSYINQIIKNISLDTAVVIYEPDSRIFFSNMYYNEMKSLLNKRNVYMYVEGINAGDIQLYFESIPEYNDTTGIYTFISPNYDILYGEIIEDKVKTWNEILNWKAAEDNTILDKADIINYNYIMNIKFIPNSMLMTDIKEVLQNKIDFIKVPAIIVAAGPSLDKNIVLLKKAQGKAFIIAVDSAIRMCLKHKITPDAVVTIDPIKNEILFENDLAKNIPVFYCLNSRYDVLDELNGPKIFVNMTEWGDVLLKKLGKEEQLVEHGGNVATSAIATAVHLGFRNIITIGLDLAFTQDKIHASVVYEEDEIGDVKQSKYTYVKDKDGKDILTYVNFKLYKEYYEQEIIKKNQAKVRFVNATEGGAYIEGAICMQIEDAIKQYCQTSFYFSDILTEVTDYTSKISVNKVQAFLKECLMQCEELKKGYMECCKNYEKLMTCTDMESVEKLINKIDQINQKIGRYIIAVMVSNASQKEIKDKIKTLYSNCELGDCSMRNKLCKYAQRRLEIMGIYINNIDKVKKLCENCAIELENI